METGLGEEGVAHGAAGFGPLVVLLGQGGADQADRIGRIRCMQIAAVLFTVSAVGSALPFALWDLAL